VYGDSRPCGPCQADNCEMEQRARVVVVDHASRLTVQGSNGGQWMVLVDHPSQTFVTRNHLGGDDRPCR
jgi:hypothetical protein